MITRLIPIYSILVFYMISAHLNGQDQGIYTNQTNISIPNTGQATAAKLEFNTPCSEFYIKKGKAWVKIDLGENYQLGSSNFGIPFQITLQLDLTIHTQDPNNSPEISFSVALDNNKPESTVFLNLEQYIDETNTKTGLTYQGQQINAIEAIISNITNTATTLNPVTDLNAQLNYQIDYGIDVSTHTITNLTHKQIPNTKVYVFNWQDSCEAPAYEFQILKLYNTNKSTANNPKQITTSINWNKALSLYLPKSTTTIDLSMAEGQGYYTWRVRPIGTYYDNAEGNNKNWGKWNKLDYAQCTDCTFTEATKSNQVYYFEDPDHTKNYQHNRIFTEGNKISEQITYATSLNQVKQTQRYIPSKNYKIITQTILDNTGRPTLNTLPTPIKDEKINQYKENFATTNGKLYTAKDFDNDDNHQNPATIDATGAFQYYSAANPDKRIPNAKGYPYTRVLYSNDGTDRISEQSGVGKTHKIGGTKEQGTRTTRTLYTTPTSDELVQLFGNEAPNHENVAKIITIDPNNTKSVSYITKEGKTIATGLTFSEDTDILDTVKTEENDNSIKGVMDKITNNIKTNQGFRSSKRITILQDQTDINISYTITQQILDGLCNDLTFDLDYNLKIEIFDIAQQKVLHTFSEPTLKDYTDTTDDNKDNITIDFGNIKLNTGTYYIQKTLQPSDEIKLEVTNAKESLEKLINPFFEWLIDFSGKVDCKEEMQYLYNDIYHFGKLVFNNQLAANISNQASGNRGATIEFNCQGCSQEKITLKAKSTTNPDAEDEFLDYYIGREDQYNITIFYFNEKGELKPIDYTQTTTLGTRKPIKVQFSTPCCNFAVPVVFTPPFKTPPTEALTKYATTQDAHKQVLESITYYQNGAQPLTTPNPQNWIHPNPNYIIDEENNFTYQKEANGNIQLQNTKAYPIDFEGYAISMLYNCKKEGNQKYTKEQAAQEIYKHMRGWHRPGLLNQMVYHMATDNYEKQACPRETPGTNPPPTSSLYEVCDIPKEKTYKTGASYSAQELAECWEPIIIDLVNKLCIGAYGLNDNGEGNVADSYDKRRNGAPTSKEHLSDNIRNFIVRWLSKPKLIRKMRRMNVNGSGGTALGQATEEIDNLVNTFLNCTGYSFGDIIDQTQETPQANFTIFQSDFTQKQNSKTNKPYTLYDRNRLKYSKIQESGGKIDWGFFTLKKDEPTNYIPSTTEEENIKLKLLKKMFPFIKDPVYAFKYFEYEDGSYPILEGETCYRDPNICIDEDTGEEFGCCGDDPQGKPIPCNFCGSGYIQCTETKKDWDCGQRFTFYGLLKNYREEAVSSVAPVNCENYYEATSYVLNPDYNKDSPNETDYVLQFNLPSIQTGALTSLEFLSVNLFAENGGYITNSVSSMEKIPSNRWFTNLAGEKLQNGISIIENEAYHLIKKCNDDCEDRRKEFKLKLIQLFKDRCYEIGECKIETNDNVVPLEDIDVLVEQMVQQCQKQCELDTYACVDESCRILGAPTKISRNDPNTLNSYIFDMSTTELGVAGPVVDGYTQMQGPEGEASQKLTYFDPLTGTTTKTDLLVSTKPLGGLTKYYFESNAYPYITMWDIQHSLTYAQATRLKQATEWDIQLDLPSKCDANGEYNPNLTYNTDHLPNEPVYVYDNNTNTWVVQTFSICTDQKEYIQRNNPDGTGDTFVERSEYVKIKKTPYSPNNPDFTTPVESPKTGINLKIDPK